MKLKAGTRLKSAVCTSEVMVIQAPDADLDLRCGGTPLRAIGDATPPSGAPAPDASGGTQIGKRYVDSAGTIELLCTKPGKGSLALAGAPLMLKEAKPLPASD